MALRKRVLCYFVLPLMLAAQILTAQHASVHCMEGADSGLSVVHSAGKGEGPHDFSPHKKSENPCDICLSAQNAAYAYWGVPALVPAFSLADVSLVPVMQIMAGQEIGYAYQARAPPSFSI